MHFSEYCVGSIAASLDTKPNTVNMLGGVKAALHIVAYNCGQTEISVVFSSVVGQNPKSISDYLKSPDRLIKLF